VVNLKKRLAEFEMPLSEPEKKKRFMIGEEEKTLAMHVTGGFLLLYNLWTPITDFALREEYYLNIKPLSPSSYKIPLLGRLAKAVDEQMVQEVHRSWFAKEVSRFDRSNLIVFNLLCIYL
jgi:hypothetical protein